MVCDIEFGPGEIADSWADFINGGHAVGLEMAFQALDSLTCLPSNIWTDYTGWLPTDGFGRDSSSSETCFWGDEPQDPPDPPDDPQEDDGTWWDITCICSDVTAILPVEVDGCLQVGASSPVTGASLMCGYAENELESYTGLDTTCVIDALADTGAGPCWPGAWHIDSIGSP